MPNSYSLLSYHVIIGVSLSTKDGSMRVQYTTPREQFLSCTLMQCRILLIWAELELLQGESNEISQEPWDRSLCFQVHPVVIKTTQQRACWHNRKENQDQSTYVHPEEVLKHYWTSSHYSRGCNTEEPQSELMHRLYFSIFWNQEPNYNVLFVYFNYIFESITQEKYYKM